MILLVSFFYATSVFSNPFFQSNFNTTDAMQHQHIKEAYDRFNLSLSIAKHSNWNENIMNTLVRPHAVKYGEVVKLTTGDGALLREYVSMKTDTYKSKYDKDIKYPTSDDFLYTEKTLFIRYKILTKHVLKQKSHFLEYASLFDQQYNTELYNSLKSLSSEELQRYFKQ